MKTLRTPPAIALPMVAVVYGTVNVTAPFLLSLVGRRVGWSTGPNVVNLFGVPLIIGGVALILWSAAAHATAWRARDWRILKFDPQHLLTPDYLVTDGPYRYTRNPLYLGDIVMWTGWTVLFGSAAVAAGLAVLVVGFEIGVRLEERGLARQFAGAWTQYAAATPRFIGRRRSSV